MRLLAVLWGALCLFFALSFSARNAHPAAAGSILPEQDLLWNVGNAEAFLRAFPPQDIRFAGVRFHYHYLTELLAAALAAVSGAACYDVFAFFAGRCSCCRAFGAVRAGAGVLSGARQKGAALPVLLFGSSALRCGTPGPPATACSATRCCAI